MREVATAALTKVGLPVALYDELEGQSAAQLKARVEQLQQEIQQIENETNQLTEEHGRLLAVDPGQAERFINERFNPLIDRRSKLTAEESVASDVYARKSVTQ
jgi:predicted nuclease with TOPRIM domain